MASVPCLPFASRFPLVIDSSAIRRLASPAPAGGIPSHTTTASWPPTVPTCFPTSVVVTFCRWTTAIWLASGLPQHHHHHHHQSISLGNNEGWPSQLNWLGEKRPMTGTDLIVLINSPPSALCPIIWSETLLFPRVVCPHCVPSFCRIRWASRPGKLFGKTDDGKENLFFWVVLVVDGSPPTHRARVTAVAMVKVFRPRSARGFC